MARTLEVGAIAIAGVLVGACKDKAPARPAPVVARDAGAGSGSGSGRGSAAAADKAADKKAKAWPQPLATFPLVEPVRVIAIATRPDVPRFDVGGPTIVGDVAVVSSSQFGFSAIDWRRGQILWAKPAGTHVAPPIARAGSAVLIGECANPPEVPDGERLLGCVRV
ncbi:MAG TPA: hypothetical protein VFP84_39520, partial [Kofleriaceae bacterium]|nr:hypothetical protein [Kofleriaceae bacterium]